MLSASSAAKELMQTDVVTIGPSDSLRDAMELMVDSHVSGLPVVDKKDRCIGVLSVTDVLGAEYDQAESALGADVEEIGSYYDPDSQQWESMRFVGSIDELPDMTVSDVMTYDIVSVSPQATLREVAALMLKEQVHRVLVMDKKQFLHGIISSLDLVRLVAES